MTNTTDDVNSLLPWDINWKRSYKVVIGVRGFDINNFLSENSAVIAPTKGKVDKYHVETANALAFGNLVDEDLPQRGLSFTFTTQILANKKSQKSETTVLTLYNVPELFLDFFNIDGCFVNVYAGYQDKVVLAYSGDVIKVRQPHKASTGDVPVTLTLKAGGIAFKNTKISVSYDKAMSDANVITDLVGRLPSITLAPHSAFDIASNVYKGGGRTLQGNAIDCLEKVLNDNNLSYATQNNSVTIIPKDLSILLDYKKVSRTNITFNEDAIKNISDVAEHKKKGTATTINKKHRIALTTFFTPVAIGQMITIPDGDSTRTYAGSYTVVGLKLALDSWGKNWDTVVEAVAI